MAVLHRERTGVGQHVDISMVDAMASLNERAVMSYGVTGAALPPGEERHVAPFGPFSARDGHLATHRFSAGGARRRRNRSAGG